MTLLIGRSFFLHFLRRHRGDSFKRFESLHIDLLIPTIDNSIIHMLITSSNLSSNGLLISEVKFGRLTIPIITHKIYFIVEK